MHMPPAVASNANHVYARVVSLRCMGTYGDMGYHTAGQSQLLQAVAQ